MSHECNGPTFDTFIQKFFNYRINLLMTDFFQETNNLDWARVINKLNCNDNKQYRALSSDGNDCRSWNQLGLCERNTTVRENCALTCNLCDYRRIAGKPGDKCSLFWKGIENSIDSC